MTLMTMMVLAQRQVNFVSDEHLAKIVNAQGCMTALAHVISMP